MTNVRTCPNCGVAESRWQENGRDCVNLDPFIGNCVDCLREYAREMRPRQKPALPFDARAAQARNDA